MRADISFLLSQIFYTIVDFSMLNMKWKNVRISRNFCCAQQRSWKLSIPLSLHCSPKNRLLNLLLHVLPLSDFLPIHLLNRSFFYCASAAHIHLLRGYRCKLYPQFHIGHYGMPAFQELSLQQETAYYYRCPFIKYSLLIDLRYYNDVNRCKSIKHIICLT